MAHTIRAAMIGVGGIAQGHIDRLRKLPAVEIVALADPSEQSLQKTRANHGAGVANAKAFTDYRQMLAEVEPEAVVICTPHTQHFPQAMACLEAETLC